MLDDSNKKNMDLQFKVREAERKFTDLEGKLKEDLMMARIRDTENTQCVAELTQKISNLEFKVSKFQTTLKKLPFKSLKGASEIKRNSQHQMTPTPFLS